MLVSCIFLLQILLNLIFVKVNSPEYKALINLLLSFKFDLNLINLDYYNIFLLAFSSTNKSISLQMARNNAILDQQSNLHCF